MAVTGTVAAVGPFDVGVIIFGAALLVLWPASVWWFVRLERRRAPVAATGDGGYRVECIHCEGLGAVPSRSGPSVCAACAGTGVERQKNATTREPDGDQDGPVTRGSTAEDGRVRVSDVKAEGETKAPAAATPVATRRQSPAWLIPTAVAAASLVVILLLVLAQ